jgi:phage-related protein
VKDAQDKLVTDLKTFSSTVDQVTTQVASASNGGNAKRLVALVPKLQSNVQTVSADAQNLQNAVNNS